MARYSRSAWQVIAVAAFAATAALAVTLTRPHPAALTETVSACRAPGVDAWMGVAGDPGTGARPAQRAESIPRHAGDKSQQVGVSAVWAATGAYYTLEFTNVSGQVCSLSGYPAVWASDGGRQIGSPATPDPSVRPSTVTLAPGATAHAVLRYTATGSFGTPACAQVTAQALRVYLPHSGGAVTVPLTIPACSRKGPGFLTVQAVQPRAGIPGFPRY